MFTLTSPNRWPTQPHAKLAQPQPATRLTNKITRTTIVLPLAQLARPDSMAGKQRNCGGSGACIQKRLTSPVMAGFENKWWTFDAPCPVKASRRALAWSMSDRLASAWFLCFQFFISSLLTVGDILCRSQSQQSSRCVMLSFRRLHSGLRCALRFHCNSHCTLRFLLLGRDVS